MQWLRKNPVINQRASIEYNDNRIALYIAQKGKCAVSGVEMFLDEIHCHHKQCWSKTKDDSYKNLILVTESIHELIHMKDNEKIKERIESLGLLENQIKKLNKLRKLINNIKIPIKNICKSF